jgi:hypothetical protein
MILVASALTILNEFSQDAAAKAAFPRMITGNMKRITIA